MQLTSKAVLMSAVISLLTITVGLQSAKALRPESLSANGLLTRECSSKYMKTFERPLTVSMGREIFNPTFYISSDYDDEAGYLTCSLSSLTPGADYPSHVRLQFGLSDRAESHTKVSVTAYVDGQPWGAEILSPRQTPKVWFVEVDAARNISIEVDCLDNCTWWDTNRRAAQKVYFGRAELEYNPSSFSSVIP